MKAVLASILAFAALAPAQKITTEFDQGADFSQFRTFYIYEGQLNTKSPRSRRVPGRLVGARRTVTPFVEGTLVINLRDTRQRALVGRAIAGEDKSDAPHIESKLDDMVKKSLDRYPPKKK